MRELILNILKEKHQMEVTKLAIAVWLARSHKEIPDGWQPSPAEHYEIQKTERLLWLFLSQLKGEGLIGMSTDSKYVWPKKEYA